MRKGQFYMIDAFFAAAILFMGITLVVTDFVSQPDRTQAQVSIQDILEILYDESITDLDSAYIRENTDILNEGLTPVGQVHLWLSNTTCTWCLPNSTALLESIILDPLPEQHGVAVVVNGTTVINRTLEHEATFRLVDTQVVVTDVDTLIIGPDPVEVHIWA